MKYWVHLNTNNFSFKKEAAEVRPTNPSAARIVEVTAELYSAVGPAWRFIDGEWIAPSGPAPTTQEVIIKERIQYIDDQLRASDPVVLEILEYQIRNIEYPGDSDKIFDERDQLRAERDKLLEIK